MPSLFLRLATLLSVLLLAACQQAGPNPGASALPLDAATSAIALGDIEVTPLNAPPLPQGATTLEPSRAPADAGGALVEPLQTPPASPPADEQDLADIVKVPSAVPAALKSEAQVACERQGGSWVPVGKAQFKACVKTTRDSGKACTRESQCDGQCLARSGTCAPFKPMYGCNEVLQKNGARVTLCIE